MEKLRKEAIIKKMDINTLNVRLMKLECKCYMDLRTKSGEPCTTFRVDDKPASEPDHYHIKCN